MLGLGLLLAVGGLATSTQDAARERLAALIAETNTLEAFHVAYTMEREGESRHLQFDFRAPDGLRARSDSPRVRSDMGCSDDVMWSHYVAVQGEEYQAQFDLLDRGGKLEEALEIFGADFWRPPEAYGVNLGFTWQPTDGRDDVYFWVGHEATDWFRPGVLLGWLDTLRQLEGELTLEGEELVHHSPDAVARVDARTGFLTSLVLQDGDSGEIRIELKRLELEPEHADDAFAPPQLDGEMKDSSQNLRDWRLNGRQLRNNAMRHVYELALRGSGRIDGEAEDELGRLVAALMRPTVVEHFAPWILELEAGSETFADWLSECTSQGVARDELEQAVRERRAQLAEAVDPETLDVGSTRPEDPEELADDPIWLRLREVEDTALRADYATLVAEPVLEHFDRVVGDALGG